MVSIPRLVIAAPASGHGKTTIATGLMAALRRTGLAVSAHKVGPDYIDPSYHALATGRPGRNLDPVLCGEDAMVPLFLHGAAGADIAVVEGVMGLFDGRAETSDGSTAHVARLLSAPVVLVVDAASQARSVAALVSGFVTFDPRIDVVGVILNRIGSERHEQILRSALDEIRVPVLGALPRVDAVSTPSRHLGLVPVAERLDAARSEVDALAEVLAHRVDLASVVAVARSAPPLAGAAWAPPLIAAPARRPIVAVFDGPAFTFCYAETTELITAAGGIAVAVDPLADEVLPAGTAALVIGGGFPEVYADELSANVTLRAAVSGLARSGAPIVAECAGLLYLCQELDERPMCGVLDASARMTDRLKLGYRTAIASVDSVVAQRGTTFIGHEFHRTVVDPGSSSEPAWWLGGRAEGFVSKGVHASYLHLHWAANPGIANRLVRTA